MRWRCAVAALLGALAAAAPATGHEASIALRQAGDAVVDKPISVVAEGTTAMPDLAIDPYNIRAKVKQPGQSMTCGPSWDTDDGASVLWADLPTGAAFAVPIGFSVSPDPGRSLVCAWVYAFNDPIPGAVAGLFVDVRAPRHQLRIVAPGTARRGRRVAVRLAGSAEVARTVAARIVRGVRGCPGSDAANGRRVRLTTVDGVQPGPIDIRARTVPLKRGAYTICAYIQKYLTDRRAETVARHVVRVR